LIIFNTSIRNIYSLKMQPFSLFHTVVSTLHVSAIIYWSYLIACRQYQDEQISQICILKVAEIELSDVARAEFLTKVGQATSSTARCVVHTVGETWECGCSPWSTDHEICHLSNTWQVWITQLLHTPCNKRSDIITSVTTRSWLRKPEVWYLLTLIQFPLFHSTA
jgi:hypothetical protein